MSDLKPCPFCGEEAEIVNAYTALRRYRAACRDCGSWGRCGDTIEAAVAHWNTRADSAALAAAVQSEREACAGIVETTDSIVRPHIARLIRSRGPAPAVDVISEDFAVTMKTIATVYEERDRVMAVVREFVYAFDAARSAFEDESVVDDAYVEAENRSEKAWAALRALVDGGGKGEKKIMGDDQCTTR